jgi:hypothetical protein
MRSLGGPTEGVMSRRATLASVAFALVAVVVVSAVWFRWSGADQEWVPRTGWKSWEQRLVAALEADQKFRLETVSADNPRRPVCAATAFGVSRTAATIDGVGDVRVYAWIRCVWFNPGGAREDFAAAAGVVAPIGATFGDSFDYDMGSDGEDYPDSLRRIFPAKVLPEAENGALSAEAEADLEHRYASLR